MIPSDDILIQETYEKRQTLWYKNYKYTFARCSNKNCRNAMSKYSFSCRKIDNKLVYICNSCSNKDVEYSDNYKLFFDKVVLERYKIFKKFIKLRGRIKKANQLLMSLAFIDNISNRLLDYIMLSNNVELKASKENNIKIYIIYVNKSPIIEIGPNRLKSIKSSYNYPKYPKNINSDSVIFMERYRNIIYKNQ